MVLQNWWWIEGSLKLYTKYIRPTIRTDLDLILVTISGKRFMDYGYYLDQLGKEEGIGKLPTPTTMRKFSSCATAKLDNGIVQPGMNFQNFDIIITLLTYIVK